MRRGRPSVATLQSASINSQMDRRAGGGAAADGDWNIFLYGAVYIVRAVSVHSLTAEKVTSLKVLMYIYIYMMKGLWSGNEKKKKKKGGSNNL